MRTLEELNVVKKFLRITNSLENGYALLDDKSKIEKYLYENYNSEESDEEKRKILEDYFENSEYTCGCAVTIDRMSNVIMRISEEEFNEYTHKDDFTGDAYLIEDLVELEEGLFVHKEKVNKYAKAIDDNHYYKKSNMTLIQRTNEYVHSNNYLNDNYVIAKDTQQWEKRSEVTEALTTTYFFSFANSRQEIQHEYIYDREVLERDCSKPVDDPDTWWAKRCLIYIECEDEWVLDEDYLREHYNRCDECDEWFPIDSGYGEYHEDIDRWICNECFEDYYNQTCEVCGAPIRDGNEYYDTDEEGNEVCLCENCVDEWRQEHSCEIGGYHCNHGVWKTYRLENEPEDVILYGTELEVEPNNKGERFVTSKAAKAAKEHMNCILSRDGSLRDGGFEIVSQPQSYEYTMSKFDDYAEAFDQIIDAGYISHNSPRCGLHVHVTAPKENRDTIVARLWLIIESYKEEFQALSRRKGDFSWSQFLSDQNYGSNVKSMYKIAKVSKDAKEDTRYLVINDRNENTIEMRIFRGTLNARTFFADLQLVRNLFAEAYNVNKPITEVTFQDLIQGEYISEYCRENGIGTDKKITDDSEKFIEIEKKIINLTKNVLDISWKYIEELKVKESKLLDKKEINKNVQSAGNNFCDINHDIYSATTYYIALLNRFRKKDIYGIISRLCDFKGYMTKINSDDLETIKKKIKKIMTYQAEL